MADPIPSQPVRVHSVAEAYLVLVVRRCPVCHQGPVHARCDLTKTDAARLRWTLDACCDACGNEERLEFRIDPDPTAEQAASDWINPTDERSRAIDLLGWLTLFRSIHAAYQKEPDKVEARRLAIECAQCLDEALRFYESDNDLPPDDAFFTDEGRRRFRDHPRQFARPRWQHERSRLPTVVFRTHPGAPHPARPWWRFWKRNPSGDQRI